MLCDRNTLVVIYSTSIEITTLAGDRLKKYYRISDIAIMNLTESRYAYNTYD